MLYLEWSRNDRQIKVIQGPLIWYMDVSCVVRNELNGWRPNPRKDQREEIVYAITETNRETRIPVMPRDFPLGRWAIESIDVRDNPYQRPFFIRTNAHQSLDIWDLDNDGGYMLKTKNRIDDWMYGLHCSSSNTTLGCIKIHEMKDLERLVDDIYRELAKDINPLIEVTV